jgi:hypothetical protein
MFLLNLSLGQFLAIFGGIGAFAVALYLLDRTRRRQVVATLKFWVEPGRPAPESRRKKIQQPLSLFLQLLGMLLLLLAIGGFQFGGRQNARRDHVLVLDTSAWMGALLPNRPDATLMDLARANALGWLRAVPAEDRVLVLRADGLATPATSWETDRRNIARAILDSRPGSTTLNLSHSLDFARQLQRRSGSFAGEIVYAGPGRISAAEANNMTLPEMPAFRVLAVSDAIENCGLRSVGARRSPTDKGTWDVLVRARNYGRNSRTVTITLNFGNTQEGSQSIDLPPGQERETTFKVRTVAAGVLETRLYPKDPFGADNYAALDLPSMRSLPVVVYSEQPDALRPVLAADPRIAADFRPVVQYGLNEGAGNRGLTILDRFDPPSAPTGNSLWIDPPAGKSPVPVKERVDHPADLAWTPDQPLTAGLRARDVQIDSTSVFEPGPNMMAIARVEKGPVIVASASADGKSKMVVMGFNPFAGPMRYELATPLLLANLLRWVAPDIFRDVDVATQSAGSVTMPLNTGKESVQVLTDAGTSLPFNVRGRAVEFFTGESSRVRVIVGNSERVYSLTLPEMWDVKWAPPATARKGIPAINESVRRSSDLWPFLALLGAALLIGEWLAYGRYSATRLRILKPKLGRAA